MSCCGPTHGGIRGKMIHYQNRTIYAKSSDMQNINTDILNRESKTPSYCLPRKKKPTRGCCVDIGPNHPIEYPDPAIYSQSQQLLLGNIPSWDNPDITTNNWGPFTLMNESKII